MIYIPIWFYSNESGAICYTHMKTFTFQYGSTQMKLLIKLFQICTNLHSNMVLLKWTACYSLTLKFRIYIPIWFYSNQRASNWKKAVLYLHSNMVLLKSCGIDSTAYHVGWFTFQYGSTQIHRWRRYMEGQWLIYIPIWYIPIWFYSNWSIL